MKKKTNNVVKKKRESCVADSKIRKFWFELPAEIYEAFINECKESAIPKKSGLVMAMRSFIKDSKRFRAFLAADSKRKED